MTQFDMLLRRALMDANLAQYETVIRQVEAAEPDFSPRYLRERTRLLADPQGWGRRQTRPGGGRPRLNWRLIAIVAALLLLSACAYAVATGQFSQWFPKLGVDPAAPETSEELLGRMGTVIEESQTVNGETVTLHAAVWDGEILMLSLTAEVPGLPEKVVPGTFLDFGRCTLEPAGDQREAYTRLDAEAHSEGMHLSQEELEQTVRNWLSDDIYFHSRFTLLRREKDVLTFEVRMELEDHLENTEMTLHLENILARDEEKIPADIKEHGGNIPADFKADIPVLNGPFDFTFPLAEPVPPISYAGDIPMTLSGIPLRFTGFKISFHKLTPAFMVPAPVNSVCARGLGKPMSDPDLVDSKPIEDAVETGELVRGFWKADGGYVDCSGGSGQLELHSVPDWTITDGTFIVEYPHIVDPPTVTAVDIAGTRVELSELERLTDYQEFFKNF